MFKRESMMIFSKREVLPLSLKQYRLLLKGHTHNWSEEETGFVISFSKKTCLT